MMLVRRNSRSAMTRRNRVELQQDAAVFYTSMMEDMKAARHSIHLQYFIWRADEFTENLRDIMTVKAGVEVRLLYDPVGSHASLSRTYIREMQAVRASGWRRPRRSTSCTRSATATTGRSPS